MVYRTDVARLAGVSPRTVSNVVSGAVPVAPETRERVLRVIEELGYRPSEMGRMLRVGRSGMIGAMVPELDTPYFAELTRWLVEAAADRGYALMIEQTMGKHERERDLLTRAGAKALFEGLIVNSISLSDEDLSRSAHSTRPIVLLGEEPHPGFDHVLIDNFAAAEDAVRHLLGLGRRNIVAIGAEEPRRSSSALRLSGFESAIAGTPPTVTSTVMYVDGFSRRGGAEAVQQLLREGELPDALFCFSDVLAIGAIRALHESGVRVPEQVAVIGFDDIEEGRYSWPSLTTVAPDKKAIASTAVDALVARIGGADNQPARHIVPHQLIERESTNSAVSWTSQHRDGETT